MAEEEVISKFESTSDEVGSSGGDMDNSFQMGLAIFDRRFYGQSDFEKDGEVTKASKQVNFSQETSDQCHFVEIVDDGQKFTNAHNVFDKMPDMKVEVLLQPFVPKMNANQEIEKPTLPIMKSQRQQNGQQCSGEDLKYSGQILSNLSVLGATLIQSHLGASLGRQEMIRENLGRPPEEGKVSVLEFAAMFDDSPIKEMGLNQFSGSNSHPGSQELDRHILGKPPEESDFEFEGPSLSTRLFPVETNVASKVFDKMPSKVTGTNSNPGTIPCANPINKTHELGKWNKTVSISYSGMTKIHELNFSVFQSSKLTVDVTNCNVHFVSCGIKTNQKFEGVVIDDDDGADVCLQQNLMPNIVIVCGSFDAQQVFKKMPLRRFIGSDCYAPVSSAQLHLGNWVFDPGRTLTVNCKHYRNFGGLKGKFKHLALDRLPFVFDLGARFVASFSYTDQEFLVQQTNLPKLLDACAHCGGEDRSG